MSTPTRENIPNRLLMHAAAFNVSLILRQVLDAATPRLASPQRRAHQMGLLRVCFGLEAVLAASDATQSADPRRRPQCSHAHRGARQ